MNSKATQIFIIIFILGLVSLYYLFAIKNNSIENKSAETDLNSTYNYIPSRIVSLPNAATEILFSLGAGDKIVGVSSNCDYPPDALKITKAGSSYGSVNIEMILSLKPDLVICSKSVAEILKKTNVKTFIVSTCAFNDIYKLIIDLGKITGKNIESEKIVSEMKNRVASIIEKQKKYLRKPLVYFESGKTFGKTRGKGSLTHDLIELAGGTNIAAELNGSFPIINNEFIIQKNPDIIITEEYGASIDEIKSRIGWNKINAVINNKILKTPVYYTNYTPRCIEAVEVFYSFFYKE